MDPIAASWSSWVSAPPRSSAPIPTPTSVCTTTVCRAATPRCARSRAVTCCAISGSTNGIHVGGVRVSECTLYGNDQLISLGETDLRLRTLAGEVHHPLSARASFGSVLGDAPLMRQMFAVLERAASTDSTVLLEGESGTGKEVVAESLHRASSRKKGPLVVIDCSTIPPNLIESELFGYEKGAFTGAASARAGAIEEASGGTLFLDEIGELPLDMQPKFLRALERRHVKRIGSTDYRDVNVRVVAATNRDLKRCVSEGKFRSDW